MFSKGSDIFYLADSFYIIFFKIMSDSLECIKFNY